MAKKSGMLSRMESAADKGFMLGQRFTRQLCMDQAAIILNRDFGFGSDRLERFNAAMVELYGQYADIWNKDSKDVVYSKETMDRALKQIWGDKFVPWNVRYDR